MVGRCPAGRPLALVGAVVEVAAVGQGKAGDLLGRMVDGGVVDADAGAVHDQAGVAGQRQVAERGRRRSPREVVATEGGEAEVGLAAEHGVHVRQKAAREDGGQRAARHQQSVRQTLAERVGHAQGVAGEAHHRRDPDDRRPPRDHVIDELVERAEGAVEDPRLHAGAREMGAQQRRTEGWEQHLGPRPGTEVREHQRDSGHRFLPCRRCLSPLPHASRHPRRVDVHCR